MVYLITLSFFIFQNFFLLFYLFDYYSHILLLFPRILVMFCTFSHISILIRIDWLRTPKVSMNNWFGRWSVKGWLIRRRFKLAAQFYWRRLVWLIGMWMVLVRWLWSLSVYCCGFLLLAIETRLNLLVWNNWLLFWIKRYFI